MNNEIEVFNYEGSTVRTVEINSEVWFVAKDVCDVLELTNPTVAIEALDSDERSKFLLGRQGEANIISEPGLYALVLRSNKPEAKAFSRWVRHEVLPAIRKSGSYSVYEGRPPITKQEIEGMAFFYEYAGLKDNQAILALDKYIKYCTGKSALQAAGIELIAPTKNQLLNPTEIGKQFGLKAHRVNEILAGAGWQHKIAEKWEPLEPAGSYAVMLDTGRKHGDGTPIRQLKWDSSILEVFGELMKGGEEND